MRFGPVACRRALAMTTLADPDRGTATRGFLPRSSCGAAARVSISAIAWISSVNREVLQFPAKAPQEAVLPGRARPEAG